MIYLLHGSDFQASRKKLNEIITEYRKKNGDLNMHKFDAEETDIKRIKEILETNSLFSPQKLVVIQSLSACHDKDILFSVFGDLKNSSDTAVIILERELGVKQLEELKAYCSKIQEFKEKATEPADTKGIFRLGDSFFTDKKEALRNLMSLLDEGHEEMGIFSYLLNHARTLATVKFYRDRQKEVPASHKIHPYVVKKASALTRPLPPDYLPRILNRFFEEDFKIKTGQSKPKESLISILLG